MALFYTTHEALNDFRRNGRMNEIQKFKERILSEIPEEVKIQLKDELIELDYATPEMKIPEEYIPYKFTFKPKVFDLNKFLDEYIILVSWKKNSKINQ